MGPAPSPDASSTASELLERAGEFAVLEESLVAVRETSRGRLVLVGGEAGIGKTALLRSSVKRLVGRRAFCGGAATRFFRRVRSDR